MNVQNKRQEVSLGLGHLQGDVAAVLQYVGLSDTLTITLSTVSAALQAAQNNLTNVEHIGNKGVLRFNSNCIQTQTGTHKKAKTKM